MRWVLLAVTLVFVAIAADSWRLSRPRKPMPLSLEEPHIATALQHQSLAEQLDLERRTRWRLGNLSASVYVFGALALGAGTAALFSFLGPR